VTTTRENLASLVLLLRRGSVRQKCAAADALGALGRDAVDTAPALMEALRDPQQTTTVAAEEGTYYCRYDYVREHAVRALARVAPDREGVASAVLPVIVDLLGRPCREASGRYGTVCFETVWFAPAELSAFGPSLLAAMDRARRAR
jgi:hypothetical protein